jgi:hypothetical protein
MWKLILSYGCADSKKPQEDYYFFGLALILGVSP